MFKANFSEEEGRDPKGSVIRLFVRACSDLSDGKHPLTQTRDRHLSPEDRVGILEVFNETADPSCPLDSKWHKIDYTETDTFTCGHVLGGPDGNVLSWTEVVNDPSKLQLLIAWLNDAAVVREEFLSILTVDPRDLPHGHFARGIGALTDAVARILSECDMGASSSVEIFDANGNHMSDITKQIGLFLVDFDDLMLDMRTLARAAKKCEFPSYLSDEDLHPLSGHLGAVWEQTACPFSILSGVLKNCLLLIALEATQGGSDPTTVVDLKSLVQAMLVSDLEQQSLGRNKYLHRMNSDAKHEIHLARMRQLGAATRKQTAWNTCLLAFQIVLIGILTANFASDVAKLLS